MKSKPWIDMEADELKKEGKRFKWYAIISLLIFLGSFLFYMYKALFFGIHNEIFALFVVLFLLLAIFELTIRFHIDTLRVIKNIEKR